MASSNGTTHTAIKRIIGIDYAFRAPKITSARNCKPCIKLNQSTKEAVLKKLQDWKAAPAESVTEESEDVDYEVTECDDFNIKYLHINESQFKNQFLNALSGNIDDNVKASMMMPPKLVRNPDLDKQYLNEHCEKLVSKNFQAMLDARKKLPVFKKKDFILENIEQHQVVLISGDTGCGKTTQVAQFILDSAIEGRNASMTNIICTQPRRISATSIAERVAAERGESMGTSVGFQIRLEKCTPRNVGGILFCTTGILLQYLLKDPALREYSHIILDEIHERNTQSDFILALLKQIIPYRPEVKIILMSATMEEDKFSRYFGGCPVLHIPGFTHPIKEYFLEDVLKLTGFRFQEDRNRKKYCPQQNKFNKTISPLIREIEEQRKYPSEVINQLKCYKSENLSLSLIFELAAYISENEPRGAILIFLPGIRDVTDLHEMMLGSSIFSTEKYHIYEVHSKMPSGDQKAIFDIPPDDVRKIVIATSIAETSITIEDVVYVIDCGKAKMSRFDKINNIQSLNEEWETKTNACQRSGRAGRLQPGVCYHLFTSARGGTFDITPLPEMCRTRLEEVVLQLKILQLGNAEDFLKRVLDPPDVEVVRMSVALLQSLNALDKSENLTPLGFHLAHLPMDPRTGKMILLAAIYSCVNPIFSIAASLSHKDAFYTPPKKKEEAYKQKLELGGGQYSDHLILAEALMRFDDPTKRAADRRALCKEYFLSWNTLESLQDMKKQFAEYLQSMKFLSNKNPMDKSANKFSTNKALIKGILCAGLYPNVAKINPAGGLLTPQNESAKLHSTSINEKATTFPSPYLVYFLKRKYKKMIFLHDSTSVSPESIIFAAPTYTVVETGSETIITVLDSIVIRCERQYASIIEALHFKLNCLLEYKYTHPEPTKWDSEDGEVLSAIVTILTDANESMGL